MLFGVTLRRLTDLSCMCQSTYVFDEIQYRPSQASISTMLPTLMLHHMPMGARWQCPRGYRTLLMKCTIYT